MFTASVDDLAIIFNGMTVYLLFYVPDFMKNLWNNLLNLKRFLFPEFISDSLLIIVTISEDDISWGLLQNFMKKIKLYKQTRKLLQNWQEVCYIQETVSKFYSSTGNLRTYNLCKYKKIFPRKIDSDEFLNLLFAWWTI